MILLEADGSHFLDFSDWVPEMMALASLLWDLPARPGDNGQATHELGVDRLARLPRGMTAIDALRDHVGEFEFRPDEDEVVQLGKTLLAVDREVTALRREPVMTQKRRKNNPSRKFCAKGDEIA